MFEVKAAEDISSPDNQGDILYHKGDLVDTITTDAAGEAQTKLLPLGKYQVSEKLLQTDSRIPMISEKSSSSMRIRIQRSYSEMPVLMKMNVRKLKYRLSKGRR